MAASASSKSAAASKAVGATKWRSAKSSAPLFCSGVPG